MNLRPDPRQSPGAVLAMMRGGKLIRQREVAEKKALRVGPPTAHDDRQNHGRAPGIDTVEGEG